MANKIINGFNCRYEISGDNNAKETILFLNGIASPIESWNNMVPYYTDDYRILRLDYRGQWFSEVTPPPYSFLNHADDIKTFLDEMNCSKTHIISTSLGGEIAMHLAIKHPEKVQSLTVIASVSEIDKIMIRQVDRWKFAAQNAVDMLDANPESKHAEILKEIGHNFLDNAIPEMYGNRFVKDSYEIIQARDKVFRETATRNFYQGHVYLCDMFYKLEKEERLTEHLHKIQCPSLIIAGGKDILKPPFYSETIAKNIPHAELVIFPDAGHAVAVEKCRLIANLAKGIIDKTAK